MPVNTLLNHAKTFSDRTGHIRYLPLIGTKHVEGTISFVELEVLYVQPDNFFYTPQARKIRTFPTVIILTRHRISDANELAKL